MAHSYHPWLAQPHGLQLIRRFQVLHGAHSGIESALAISGLTTVETRGGGPPRPVDLSGISDWISEKSTAVGKYYGETVGREYQAAVSGGEMISAYAARAEAWASGDEEGAKKVSRHVNAAENQIIGGILTKGVGQVPSQVGSRDVAGAGGYIYRQYADNSVTILQAPGQKGVGTTLRSGTAWQAITNEIGPFPPHLASPLPKASGVGTFKIPDVLLEKQGVQDALKVGTAAAAPLAAPAAALVGALLSGAAASSAVPVGGWIVAGGLAAAAATIQLVQVLKQGKMRRSKVVQLAQQLGVPDAAEVPAWLTHVSKLSSEQRNRLGDKLAKLLKKKHLKDQHKKKIEAKLRILAAIELESRAAKLKAAAAGGPKTEFSVKVPGTDTYVTNSFDLSIGSVDPRFRREGGGGPRFPFLTG